MRSTDAGVSFTDMTNDAQNPPLGMHPDQHAIVFASDPDIAIVGSDGGVIRTDGTTSTTRPVRIEADRRAGPRGLRELAERGAELAHHDERRPRDDPVPEPVGEPRRAADRI